MWTPKVAYGLVAVPLVVFDLHPEFSNICFLLCDTFLLITAEFHCRLSSNHEKILTIVCICVSFMNFSHAEYRRLNLCH